VICLPVAWNLSLAQNMDRDCLPSFKGLVEVCKLCTLQAVQPAARRLAETTGAVVRFPAQPHSHALLMQREARKFIGCRATYVQRAARGF
jgi:hypothetical protein